MPVDILKIINSKVVERGVTIGAHGGVSRFVAGPMALRSNNRR